MRGGHAYSALRLLEPAAFDELSRSSGRLARGAEPFIELTDALPADLVADLQLEFPPPETDPLAMRLLRELGYGFRRLDELLGCPELIELLGRVRGEKHLVHDFDYESGGAREETSGAPIQLSVIAHPRGWRRRLTLVLALDPDWTAMSGTKEFAAKPATRCRMYLFPTEDWTVGDFAIAPPRDRDGSTKCRLIVAHYYAQGEASPRPIGAPKPRNEAAGLPFADRLRAAAHNPRLAHGIMTAEIARLAHEIERLGREAHRHADQFRDALWTMCSDGSAPLGEAELELCRRLPALWQPLADGLARTAEVVDAAALAARATPILPIQGSVTVDEVSGRWRDGWVSPMMIVRFVPRKTIRAIVVEGFVPEAIATKQRLFATVSECVHQMLPPIREFKWRFAITDTPGEPIVLRIAAASGWRPIDDGSSGDTRALAWYLSRICIEHDR
jgi:hypothetical protein